MPEPCRCHEAEKVVASQLASTFLSLRTHQEWLPITTSLRLLPLTLSFVLQKKLDL
jgi:hypothetical protein